MPNLRRRKWAGSLKPWLALCLISSVACGLPALPLAQRWQLGISVALAQELPNARLEEADQLRQQGIQQFNRGQTQQALETFQHELELRRQLGDPEGEWRSLGWIGLIYQRFGQYQQALELYQEGLRIAQTSEDGRGEGVMPQQHWRHLL